MCELHLNFRSVKETKRTVFSTFWMYLATSLAVILPQAVWSLNQSTGLLTSLPPSALHPLKVFYPPTYSVKIEVKSCSSSEWLPFSPRIQFIFLTMALTALCGLAPAASLSSSPLAEPLLSPVQEQWPLYGLSGRLLPRAFALVVSSAWNVLPFSHEAH